MFLLLCNVLINVLFCRFSISIYRNDTELSLLVDLPAQCSYPYPVASHVGLTFYL